MAAKIKASRRIWIFILPILLFSLMFLYIRNKIDKLHCSSQESLTTFSQSVLRFFHRMFGSETPVITAQHYRSQLCDKNIVAICLIILTVNLPEDINYWLAEIARDSDLREFIIRLSIVAVIVMCVILCNLYKWQGLVDDDVVVAVSSTKTVQKIRRENGFQSKTHSFDRHSTWTFWRIAGLAFTLLTLISIPWEFARLYQKEVSVRAAKTTAGEPQECFPGGMGIFQSLRAWSQHHFSWSDDDPCGKYYYYLLVDPLWELTPLMVLSSAASRCILHPMEQLFSGLGRSMRMFFQEIPVQWQPVIMMMSVLLLLVTMLMKFRYRLSVPLLLRFEPRTPVEDRESSTRIQKQMINLDNSYIDCYIPNDKCCQGGVPKRQSVARGRRKKVERD
ncbi:uncharacterized protein LOC121377417 [Gigantopelta aegis]|uniref:uncharacterized protein LOC121377417 n=1 Tax=Gigantopelta aegis TaxID=1735272 RepID=UPI001B8885DF|nr:uncharacterized protein LOC121377417 [Gigantopelta aegis]